MINLPTGVVLILKQREEKRKELERQAKETEVECQKKETEARDLKEKLEARCDSHSLQEAITLTPSQKETRRSGSKREKEERQREARELEDKHEVCFDPRLFQRDLVPTL